MSLFDSTGKRLRMARIAAGYKTARAFCDKYNVPHSTYSLHETGRRNLKPKIAQQYADLLHVSVAWLLTGMGLPQSHSMAAPKIGLSSAEDTTSQQYQIAESHNSYICEVNTLLFCKIVLGIQAILQETGQSITLEKIADTACKIYNDIISASTQQEEQLSMVNLSMTIFKREIISMMEQTPNRNS